LWRAPRSPVVFIDPGPPFADCAIITNDHDGIWQRRFNELFKQR
jgi:hypothetical protein